MIEFSREELLLTIDILQAEYDRCIRYDAQNRYELIDSSPPGLESALEKLKAAIISEPEMVMTRATGYFCPHCQTAVAGKMWDGTGYTKILCDHCDLVLDQ